MCLKIFKFKPNSSQLGALEGKDMVSEHFAFSSIFFRSLKRTMQWQLSIQLRMSGTGTALSQSY